MKRLNPGLQVLLIGGVVFIIMMALMVMFFQWQESNIGHANQELDVFYMYGNSTDTYWLEPQAEYENVIYVPRGTLDEWGIEPTQLGERYKATFDPTGWDILAIYNKEEQQ